jgi:hypothetical protein
MGPSKNKKIIMSLLWAIICLQVGKLEEINEFLKIYNLPKLNHKSIKNLKRLIASEDIEAAIKTNLKCPISQLQKAQDQMASLEN